MFMYVDPVIATLNAYTTTPCIRNRIDIIAILKEAKFFGNAQEDIDHRTETNHVNIRSRAVYIT